MVLIGQQTWLRPWVRYEIAESIRRKNGLLGIYIHHQEIGQTGFPQKFSPTVEEWNLRSEPWIW